LSFILSLFFHAQRVSQCAHMQTKMSCDNHKKVMVQNKLWTTLCSLCYFKFLMKHIPLTPLSNVNTQQPVTTIYETTNSTLEEKQCSYGAWSSDIYCRISIWFSLHLYYPNTWHIFPTSVCSVISSSCFMGALSQQFDKGLNWLFRFCALQSPICLGLPRWSQRKPWYAFLQDISW
jgi:hypothetical protein